MMFCDELKEKMQTAGLNAGDLHRECYIPLNTVHSWMQGVREPPEWLQDVIIHYILPKAKRKKDKK